MDDEKRGPEIGTRLKKFLEANPNLEKKLTRELQKNLVTCLLDGTVYSIVDSLKDLQFIREKYGFWQIGLKMV